LELALLHRRGALLLLRFELLHGGGVATLNGGPSTAAASRRSTGRREDLHSARRGRRHGCPSSAPSPAAELLCTELRRLSLLCTKLRRLSLLCTEH